MFKTFKIGGGDESGRPVDPSGAMKKHARWCIDTVKNNTPDEEALQYILDNCVSWVECPAELSDVFAGHAAYNAYGDILMSFENYKRFFTDEEIQIIKELQSQD